jgi:hypothetical protein
MDVHDLEHWVSMFLLFEVLGAVTCDIWYCVGLLVVKVCVLGMMFMW